MSRQVAVVTNAMEYMGPPIAAALAAEGFHTLCQSEDFSDSTVRAVYEAAHPDNSPQKPDLPKNW